MSDYLQAFLNGDPLPVPKKRLIPSFSVKARRFGESSVKEERDRSQSFNYAEKLRAQEENEILTKILNRPADQTLGINEEQENSAIPPTNDVFLKYEFDLEPVKLPIHDKRQEILEQLERNEVIIIRATTGSGKSSQVPQYILEEAHRNKKNVNIIVTQPRRISAQSLASRVALERKCEVGSLIGYQIGLDRKVSNTDTRLLYCTTGVFLQKLINEKTLKRWSHCIIDEIHERDMDMDFVLLILRRLMSAKHTGTKLILMSATMETESISNYFMNYFSPKSEFKPAILDLKVPRPHPVKVDYLDAFKRQEYFGVLKEFIDIKNPSIEPTMYTAGVEILKLLADKGMKSFLIFLPGWYEIENFYHELLKVNQILVRFTVIKLHSTMGMDDIKGLYNQNVERKIIISTNIAESSITIPDIDFIIDYCLMKHLETETSSNLTQLKMVWASKVNLRQREGRVGRTKHGQVVRMIFEEHFEKMPDEAPAEMQRTSLEAVILKAKQLKMGKPIDILGLALSPPPRHAIIDAILVLKELGALTRHNENGFDFEDGDLTFVGEIMSNVPVDVRLSKLIVLGYMFNVLKEMIIIAAGLSVRSIFKQSSVKRMDTFEAKFTFGSGSSDVLAILNVYKTWTKFMEEKHNKLEQKNFEFQNHLDVRNLRDMNAHIHDIMKRLEQLGFSKKSLMENRVEKYSERMFLIKICIAGAFYPNFYIFGGDIPDRDAFNTLNYKNPCHTIYYKSFQNNHCGDLYKNQIIEHLLNNEIIKTADDAEIHFDTNSTRVVVEFKNLRNDEDVKVPGDVKFEVYKALRFARHHGKYNLKLELSSIAKENDYLQRKRYKTEEGCNKMKKDDGQCIYPKARASVVGYVTSIISPGKFYIQPEVGREKLHKFKSKILIPSALTQIGDLRECVRENLIIVRNMKNEFYRAQIIESPYQNKQFKVRLIDFGNNVRCEFEDFYTFIGSTREERRELLKGCFRYPPLCFEAKLAECKPAVIYQTGWSSNATDKFKEIIDEETKAGRKIDIKVYAFNNYDKVVSVYLNLNETMNRRATSVNHLMSLYGYTQIANESYIYQISRVTDEIKTNAKNEHFDFKDYSDAPRGFDKLTLTGPISTFSHNNFERTTHCHESDITIDPWSVNSILIDPYPFDGIRKVMVAACRSKNDKGKITLRHTTVLPHVTGMACLLALIFCPTAQFRYDKNFNRFTSILTGLGCSFDGKSYYKEHDCLFHTDVDLDAEDIANINELREIMSELMEKFQLSNENYREELAGRAQDKLFEIMQRNRAQIGATLRDGYSWNGENALKEDYNEKMRMFPSLNPRSLQPYSIERWKTLKNLNEEFEEKASTNVRDECLDCVLCDERVETLYELKIHVLKSKHANLVINLEKSKPEEPAVGRKREYRYTVDSECGDQSQRTVKKEKYD